MLESKDAGLKDAIRHYGFLFPLLAFVPFVALQAIPVSVEAKVRIEAHRQTYCVMRTKILYEPPSSPRASDMVMLAKAQECMQKEGWR